MIQKIKQLAIVAFASLTLLAPGLLVPVINGVASADNISDNLCAGVNDASGDSNCTTQTTGDGSAGLQSVAATVTRLFSIIVGAISILMIIYGGFRYITSGGDSGKVGSAKNTLIYAIVGLIIVALAQLIVRFVLTQATNTTTSIG